MSNRIVCQFSCGAASAVATKLALAEYGGTHDVQIINAFLANEEADNRRFAQDCESWFGQPITVLRDEKYGADAHEVFRRERFMRGPYGAPCSKFLKRRLLDAFSKPGDVMVLDRLFSVGDLVDRGPECRNVLEWLARPWFHPVRGNHDDYVCRFDTCDVDNWVYNGGAWFAGLSWDEQREFAAQFRELPIAIEVETPGGLVGVVHADCPFPSWDQLRAALEAPETAKQLRLTQNTCMWSRSRVQDGDKEGVEGLRALVCGHTPLRQPAVLGNVYHIDTAGWMDGHFTLLELGSLQCTPPIKPGVSHDWD